MHHTWHQLTIIRVSLCVFCAHASNIISGLIPLILLSVRHDYILSTLTCRCHQDSFRMSNDRHCMPRRCIPLPYKSHICNTHWCRYHICICLPDNPHTRNDHLNSLGKCISLAYNPCICIYHQGSGGRCIPYCRPSCIRRTDTFPNNMGTAILFRTPGPKPN